MKGSNEGADPKRKVTKRRGCRLPIRGSTWEDWRERRLREMAGSNGEDMASQVEEAMLEKKYGGIVPKKKPLISNDNERAYFDSADWALGKQGTNKGQNTRSSVESLRPKLQRTPHHQLPPRRPACTPGGENRA